MTLFRTIFLMALAIATAALAVANRHYVPLSFDPFNSTAPAIVVQAKLFWIVLASALIGVLLGGWSTWLAQATTRQALRDAEEKVRRLERENEVAQKIIVKPSTQLATRVADLA